jgi:hypothetical protein
MGLIDQVSTIEKRPDDNHSIFASLIQLLNGGLDKSSPYNNDLIGNNLICNNLICNDPNCNNLICVFAFDAYLFMIYNF